MSKSDFIRHFFAGLVLVAFIAAVQRHIIGQAQMSIQMMLSFRRKSGLVLFDDPAMREFQIKVESFKGFCAVERLLWIPYRPPAELLK